MPLIGSLLAVCKQYGPGRLPYAGRRDVGAGYAMATATAVATTAFIVVTQLVGISTIMSSWYVAYAGTPSEQVVGMAATIPAAFSAGVVVWRIPGLRERLDGVPAGLAAMVLMYPLSGMLDIFVIFIAVSPMPVMEYLVALYAIPIWGVFSGLAALTTTFWLTLPLGALGAYVHERARAESTAGNSPAQS